MLLTKESNARHHVDKMEPLKVDFGAILPIHGTFVIKKIKVRSDPVKGATLKASWKKFGIS